MEPELSDLARGLDPTYLLIRDERDFTAHVEYIHFNPVKHGLVKRPRDWQHSSFMDWVRRGCYDTDWAADAEPIFPECTGGE